MLLIGDNNNKDLSGKVAEKKELELIYPEVKVFPDGERRVRLLSEVAGERVIILKSTGTPVDNNLLELCFTIDACRRNGAEKIYVIIPYLPYARADHMFRTGDPIPFEFVIAMLEKAGMDEVLFVDPHTIRAPELFHVPVKNETALPLFAQKIEKLGLNLDNTTIVSPDMGGIRRIKMLSELLGGMPFMTINKDRDLDTGKVTIAGVEGEVKQNVILVDDMISSGGTLVQAIDYFHKQGVKHIYAFVTHPVFSADATEKLEKSPVTKVFVTDSLPIQEGKSFPRLEVLSIDSVIAKGIEDWLPEA